MKATSSNFKSAFIALVGRPNSGKSTLLNTILDENISIVTPVPQTTRRNIRGIYNGKGYQLIFVDTPGMNRGKYALNKSMYIQSTQMFTDRGVDIICYLVDLSRTPGDEEDEIAGMVEKLNIPFSIVFNKSDLCQNAETFINDYFYRYPKLANHPTISITAISKSAKETFITMIEPFIPFGPPYYPEEYITDSNLRFFAAEYIRKQIINLTFDEVPHASCVEILDYKEFKDYHQINAVIHVETNGQKAIVIGKRGRIINKIRKQAEKELTSLTGLPAKISCHVKVTPKWRDNEHFLSEICNLKP